MNKKILLIILLASIVVLAVGYYLFETYFYYGSFECRQLHSKHVQLIKESNYCEKDSDCTIISDMYCWVDVNNETINIVQDSNRLLFEKKCEIPLSCLPRLPEEVYSQCVNGKCVRT